MLGTGENGEERKLWQKTDIKYNFFRAWLNKEKRKEKKIRRKLELEVFLSREKAQKIDLIMKNKIYQTKNLGKIIFLIQRKKL